MSRKMIPLDDAIKIICEIGLTSPKKVRQDLENISDIEECYANIVHSSVSRAKKIEIAVKHFLKEVEDL